MKIDLLFFSWRHLAVCLSNNIRIFAWCFVFDRTSIRIESLPSREKRPSVDHRYLSERQVSTIDQKRRQRSSDERIDLFSDRWSKTRRENSRRSLDRHLFSSSFDEQRNSSVEFSFLSRRISSIRTEAKKRIDRPVDHSRWNKVRLPSCPTETVNLTRTSSRFVSTTSRRRTRTVLCSCSTSRSMTVFFRFSLVKEIDH